VKKLLLLPFLVFGQFIGHAQKPANKAQQVITMNLLVAGPVHLPKTNNVKVNGKVKNQTLAQQLEVSLDRNTLVNRQELEPVKNEDNTAQDKNKTVIYTISSL